MLLRRFRASSAPVAVLTTLSFVLTAIPPRPARADEPAPLRAVEKAAAAPSPALHDDSGNESHAPREAEIKGRAHPSEVKANQTLAPASPGTHSKEVALAPAHGGAIASAGSTTVTPDALSGGDDKTGASSQAISVPQGTGKVQGMGESFSTQMSTGVASFSVPFSLAHARGAVQPQLALTYSSGGGHGLGGVGWDMGTPFVARQTDRGVPRYDDRADWYPQQDRFVWNGGQELVPICTVTGGTCNGALVGETMPAWANAWQYFRPRIEGAYLRFFWSPDHRTWRVQSKAGTTMELGVPLDGSGDSEALETDPSAPGHVFRWNLIRHYDDEGTPPPAGDAAPKPVNVVLYRYENDGNMAYLTDIYDTPRAGAKASDVTAFAHHAKIEYEWRPDMSFSYRRGWRVDQSLRVRSVEVASMPLTTAAGAGRKRVRKYHVSYDPAYQVSLLTSVQLEGRCSGSEASAPNEGDAMTCDAMPPITFDYQHVVHGSNLFGYEAMNESVSTLAGSPPHSLDDKEADLFDVDGDGLPDLLATMPGQYGYGNGHTVFFNGDGGHPGTFGAPTPMSIRGITGEDAAIIRLSNPNVSALDVNGDGIIDFLNMPQTAQYSVYSPMHSGGSWAWVGTAMTTASQQSPKIDFRHNPGTLPGSRVMDVNGDGLVDVVAAVGTTSDPTAPPSEYQTFFALGRYPGGAAQYGTATWTSATTATIANDPVAFCGPWSGGTVGLSDPDVRVADMNGDGLGDIVRVRDGELRYWPGRGNGFWGTGPLGGCAAGADPSTQSIAMTAAPHVGLIGGSTSILVDDVNGDGRDDIVVVAFDAVTVYLNINGTSWTDGHIVTGTPPRPAGTNRVRLVDIDGNGTRDIVWGQGNAYKYLDLLGGVRPWTLTHIDNGLGKTTDIEYGSSTDMMLAAKAAGQAWTSTAPMPLHIVRSVTERDNLVIVGRPAGEYITQYVYSNPVYDGRQREFRGFRSAVATRWGDANSPTSMSASTFLLGECADDEPPPAGATSACDANGQWADNPREGLKGLPVTTETYDENGTYQSSDHHQYTIRKLYDGRDGRAVRTAFESQLDTWKYDVANFAKAESTATMTDIIVDSKTATTKAATLVASVVRASTGTAHLRKSSGLDLFGNPTDSLEAGCIDGSGCVAIDTPIHATKISSFIPDNSGWTARMTESYSDGLVAGEKRHHLITSYDTNGRTIRAQAELVGTLPLDRFHAVTGAAHAGNAAPGGSVDGVTTLTQWAYDAFGNVIAQSAPGGRCHTIDYTTDFADAATREHVFAGYGASGTCGPIASPHGATDLVATATYDRGFGAITDVLDIHQEHTRSVYDGLGRLVQLWKPSPTHYGATSPIPSIVIDYDLAHPGRPYSIVHTSAQNGASDSDATYRDSYAYADGMARTIVTIEQADPSVDLHGFVVQGLTEYDHKGAERRKYMAWFWDGDPRNYPLAQAPIAAFSRQRYDAFGHEIQSYALDNTLSIQSVYHALSTDKWDAADLDAGPHAASFATERRDGHDRIVSAIERVHVTGGLEVRETRTEFLPTGEPYRVTRTRGKGDDVVRWMRYDTLGRMTLNVEPNTSAGFTTNVNADPQTVKAWRYAYDDNGNLAGTSDARGCGVDYYYDSVGRIVAEDYSPCAEGHALYSSPDPSSGSGVEVYYQYDSVPTTFSGETAVAPSNGSPAKVAFDACVVDPQLQSGRLIAVSDRGSRTISSVDGRGRLVCAAKQLAKPGGASNAPADRYTPTWYARTIGYDGADRAIDVSTGARSIVDPQTGSSIVHTEYTSRGTVKRVASSYGTKDASGWADIIHAVSHDADGLAATIAYGDAAHTMTVMSHDLRRRLSSVQTYRGPPAEWTAQPAAYAPAPEFGGTSAPSTFQLLLTDVDYTYDAVDNPIEIHDWRNPSEWPLGAQPVTQKIQYDDTYRATRVDYVYPSGSDRWVDPFDAEDHGAAAEQDGRRAKPSPHLTFPQRALWSTYRYDWLGNTVQTDDDAKGFFDRSLGTIANGAPGAGPYQLKAANGGAAPRDGSLTATYDAAGELTGLSVARNANAPCTPASASCSQRYAYTWDEVGHLARARRWDGAGLGAAGDPLPTAAPAVDLAYAYDAKDNRVLKAATDSNGVSVYTAYIFETLELRRATFDGTTFEDTVWTEVPYLFSHGVRIARIHYAATDVPTATSGQIHVFIDLPDHLGSSSIVIDRETSELVERSTYLSSGAADSDYRPARWDSYREDYRFTGKEEDVEVGIQYFGKRYYNANLGRWLSPDPLALHGMGADPNLYAYVKGEYFRSTDPFGLDSELRHYSQWDVFAQTMSDVGKMAEKVPGFMYDGGKQTVVDTAVGLVHTAEKTADVAVRTVDAIANGDTDGLKQIGHEAVEAAKDTAVGAVQGTIEGGKQYATAMWNGDVETISKTSGSILVQAAMIKGGEVVGKSLGAVAKAAAPEAAAMEEGVASKAVAQAEGKACTGGACGGTGTCFVGGTLVATASGRTPIETIHVGDRVLAAPDDTSSAETRVVAAEWRMIRLTMPNSDGSGDVLDVTVLRPASWVEARFIVAGASLAIAFPELDIAGWATVVAIEACPKIAEGVGHVVLGTVSHVSREVVALDVAGTSIETTPMHPFYSRDRDGWVSTKYLAVGEQLAAHDHDVRVLGLTAKSGLSRVYNFEVEERHTYQVSNLGVLVHNANCTGGAGGGAGGGSGGSGGGGGGGGGGTKGNLGGNKSGTGSARGGTKLAPDPDAAGPHTTFKRDPTTGKLTGHAEWDANGNPVKRTDITTKTQHGIQGSHTHEYGSPNVDPKTGKTFPGNEVNVRPATPGELPK